MDNRCNGLAGAMREISHERDCRLRDADQIGPERLETLQAFLATELPVDTALFAVAKRRDASLSREPALPSMVRAALVQELRSGPREARLFDGLRQLIGRVHERSLSGAFRTAAALAAIVLTFLMLQVSRWRGAANQPSPSLPASPGMTADLAAFFSDATPLRLRVSRLELASLDRSLLTINRAWPELEAANRHSPLDLSIQPIKLDVETVTTP